MTSAAQAEALHSSKSFYARANKTQKSKSASKSHLGSAKSSSTSKTTTNHAEIKKWVEKHGGKPATIADTQHRGEEAGLLRIDFPGGAGDPPLEAISWEQFFEKFDEAKLALLYQEEKADGSDSTFCKFIHRT